MLDLLRRQRELGQIAEADVVAQEAALAQVEQTLPPLQKQLAQQRDLLAALSGGFPSDRLPQRFELAALRLPRDLPVSLPSNWSSSARTCAPPRPTCRPPAPRSASPSPTGCPTSR